MTPDNKVPPAHRRSRLMKVIIIGAFLALLSITIAAPLAIVANKPLGPQLVMDNLPATELLADASGAQIDCGSSPVDYVLMVGSDDDYQTGFADAIRVVRIDYIDHSATVLNVPRDLWVPIPNLEQHGIIENRVKAAYAYGNSFNVPGGGPSLLAQTLTGNFGFEIDHYLVLNFATFEASIDAIGGIDVLVRSQLGAPNQPYYFAEGLRHMDGQTTLSYVRLRGDDSDLYRINRQSDVLLAVRSKALSPQILPTVPNLILSLREATLTDMSIAQLSTLLCAVRKMDADAVRIVEVDTSMFEKQTLFEQEVLVPNYPAIRKLVEDFNAGNL